MYLQREQCRRPFFDFTKAEGEVSLMNFTEEDLVGLINYMKSYGYRLGLDFSFVMGYDSPGRKYMAAVNGASYMIWYNTPGGNNHDKELSNQKEVQLCIKMMKSEAASTDHLEDWE
jgi:hypothetical protein